MRRFLADWEKPKGVAFGRTGVDWTGVSGAGSFAARGSGAGVGTAATGTGVTGVGVAAFGVWTAGSGVGAYGVATFGVVALGVVALGVGTLGVAAFGVATLRGVGVFVFARVGVGAAVSGVDASIEVSSLGGEMFSDSSSFSCTMAALCWITSSH